MNYPCTNVTILHVMHCDSVIYELSIYLNQINIYSSNCRSGSFSNPQREHSRYLDTQKYSQNLLSYPKKIAERLSGTLHFQPDDNPEYVYPNNYRPTGNNERYDLYGRPLSPYQNSPNRYPQYRYEDQYTRPVHFPNSRPYQEEYYNQNQQNYQYPSGGNSL